MNLKPSYKIDFNEEQNLGVPTILKNLGISLTNKKALETLTPVSDMINLITLATDDNLAFSEIVFRVEEGIVDMAFLYENMDGKKFFYPVTRIQYTKEGHRGFIDSVLAEYGLKYQDISGEGYFRMFADGQFRRTNNLIKRVYSQPQTGLSEAVKDIMKGEVSADEAIEAMLKKDVKEINLDSMYAKSQLKKLGKNIKAKFTSEKGDTNLMNVDKDSAEEIIKFLRGIK